MNVEGAHGGMDSPTLIGCVDGGQRGFNFRVQSATREQTPSESETIPSPAAFNCEPGGDRATGLILDCLWRLFGHEEVEALTSIHLHKEVVVTVSSFAVVVPVSFGKASHEVSTM